jgi:hypothetical protein
MVLPIIMQVEQQPYFSMAPDEQSRQRRPVSDRLALTTPSYAAA